MSDLEGVMLSDYLLLQCISKGGVADVYRARQRGEGNYEVAVKIFRSGYAQRESFREHFMAEAEKIGQFDHPNILPYLEYGEGEGLLYLVTPFVMTGTLEDLFQRVGGKFSAMQALPVMQQLCSAVQYAHNHDVIHGNIKPTNVFIAADGRMLLSDFGITHSYDDSQQSLTRVGWGSAEYVAPEQSLGLVRRASDIYSLGALLFRVLTGQPPFTGQTPVEVLLKHVRQQAPSARSLVPTISDAVDGVLNMALQKRSDDRFASADEFYNALLAAVTVAPIASPVARPVVTRKLQLVPGAISTINPQTPLPVANPDSPDSLDNIDIFPAQPPMPIEPQTPLPAYLAFTNQVPDVREASPVLPSPLEEDGAEESESFLLGDNGADKSLFFPAEGKGDDEGKAVPAQDGDNALRFWSVDPVEWSPLPQSNVETQEQPEAMPLTAGEYLHKKSSAPALPTPLPAVSDDPEVVFEDLPKPERPRKASGAWNARLKKILPVVVVILLLLGLLGALLSSFLLPGSSGQRTNAPVATTGANGTATHTAATPTRPVATPTSATKATPTASPTAAPTRPVATPTTIPTSPVVPPFACASGSIALNGSANFSPAIQQLTGDYGSQCSGNATFTVNSGGSKSGLDAVEGGNANLAFSDLTSTGRPGMVDYQVGALIYAVIVNGDTQVTNLTTAQLQGIYSGKITNWSQVGGTDEAIQIISRASGSEIEQLFVTYVLKGTQQSVDGTVLWNDSNDAVAQKVLDTSGAISYVPLASAPINGAQAVSINGVAPAASTVSTNAYAFWGIEHLYSKQAATGLALSFISFCSTDSAANDLTSAGVVPIKSLLPAALNAHRPGPMI